MIASAPATVSTHDLRVGDIVWSHGSRFRLVHREISISHKVSELFGEVVIFRTEYLGAVPGWKELIREMYGVRVSKEWTIQGNGGAKWARE